MVYFKNIPALAICLGLFFYIFSFEVLAQGTKNPGLSYCENKLLYNETYPDIVGYIKWKEGKNSKLLKGVKWGACKTGSNEYACMFNPFDICQYPATEAVVSYSFLVNGVKIDTEPEQVNTDISLLYSTLGYKFDFKSIIRRAFKTWSCCSGINFKEVDESNADIRIGSLAISGGHIAQAFSPPYPFQNSFKYPGDIYFNTQLTMLVKRGLTKNEIEKRFYLASLHEIGHAIGLEHNNQEESIMTVNHDSLFSMDDISYNDVNNISSLYGFSESNEEQCLPLKKYIEECFVEGEIVKTKKCLPLKAEIEQSERMERAIRELHRNDL